MANPQPTDAHLRIAHEINEQIMVSLFTEQQRRILDLILRLSWGCGKKTATIPLQSDFEVVGVRQSHVKSHIDFLIHARVIRRSDTEYSFNKDYDQWRVSRAIGYSPEKLSELIKFNLNHTYGKRKSEGEELTDNGSSADPILTENGSGDLRNTEFLAYVKRNFPKANLASPKETIKETIYKEKYTYQDYQLLKNNTLDGIHSLSDWMLMLSGERQGTKINKVLALKALKSLDLLPDKFVPLYEDLNWDGER